MRRPSSAPGPGPAQPGRSAAEWPPRGADFSPPGLPKKRPLSPKRISRFRTDPTPPGQRRFAPLRSIHLTGKAGQGLKRTGSARPDVGRSRGTVPGTVPRRAPQTPQTGRTGGKQNPEIGTGPNGTAREHRGPGHGLDPPGNEYNHQTTCFLARNDARYFEGTTGRKPRLAGRVHNSPPRQIGVLT